MNEHEKLVEIVVSTDLSLSSGRLMDAYNIADNLIANGVAHRVQAKWQKQWCDNSMIGHDKQTIVFDLPQGLVSL